MAFTVSNSFALSLLTWDNADKKPPQNSSGKDSCDLLKLGRVGSGHENFFPWCPGKIELEAAFPKSTLNFHRIYSWTILSLASRPIRNCWENLLSRRWNLRRIYGRFFVRLVGFSSFIWCSWLFLFAVKLWSTYLPKRKSKPRSVSTIPNHIHLAFRRTRLAHLDWPTKSSEERFFKAF